MMTTSHDGYMATVQESIDRQMAERLARLTSLLMPEVTKTCGCVDLDYCLCGGEGVITVTRQSDLIHRLGARTELAARAWFGDAVAEAKCVEIQAAELATETSRYNIGSNAIESQIADASKDALKLLAGLATLGIIVKRVLR